MFAVCAVLSLSVIIKHLPIYKVNRNKNMWPWSEKNTWKINLLPGQGKVRDLVAGQGYLERTGKVRELEN